MAYAILRTKKLKSFGEIGGSLSHNYRTRHTPNADPHRIKNNEHDIEDAAAVMTAIKAGLPEKVRKNAVLCIEYLITASPDADIFTDPKKEAEFFKKSLEWLKAKHGAESVITTSIHRDETTPHLVAYVLPIDKKGKLNCREFLGGKAKLSKMQTDFHNEVKHLGLDRGLEGSKAEHQTIQNFYTKIQQPIAPLQQINIKKMSADDQPKSPFYDTKYEHGQKVLNAVYSDLDQQLTEIKAHYDKQFLAVQKQLLMQKQKTQAAEIAHKNSVEQSHHFFKYIEHVESEFEQVIEYKKIFPKKYKEVLDKIESELRHYEAEIEQQKYQSEHRKQERLLRQQTEQHEKNEQIKLHASVENSRKTHTALEIQRFNDLICNSTSEAEKRAYMSLCEKNTQLRKEDPFSLMNSLTTRERENSLFGLAVLIFRAKSAEDFRYALDESTRFFKAMQKNDFAHQLDDPAVSEKICIAVDLILDSRLLRYGADFVNQVNDFKEILYACECQSQLNQLSFLLVEKQSEINMQEYEKSAKEYKYTQSASLDDKSKHKTNDDYEP